MSDNDLDTQQDKIPSKIKFILPKWFWMTIFVFTLFIWLLALSIQQANMSAIEGLDDKLNVLSHFSYNLVFAVVFISLLAAFAATVIFILGRFFLQATVFILILLAPIVIPIIINASGTVSHHLSYKPQIKPKEIGLPTNIMKSK